MTDHTTIPTDLVETVSAGVHERWMRSKCEQGWVSRRSESGEELMVPYGRLSEQAKDLDRGSVVAVLDALTAAGYVTVETPVAELDIDGDWAVETGSDPVWGSLDDDGEPVIETEDALWPAAEAVELALAILAVNSRLTCESEQDGAADA